MTAFDPATNPLPVALFWTTCAAWFVMWIWIARHAHATAAAADRGSRTFLVVSLWAGLLLSFILAWTVPAVRIAGGGWVPLLVGFLLVWAGIGLRLWSVRTLGRFFRTVVTIQADHHLIDTGPYRLIRHPSYAGSVLSVTGIGLALGNWLSVAVCLAFTLVGFGRRIVVEEAALQDAFTGSYKTYTRHTWRLVPFVW